MAKQRLMAAPLNEVLKAYENIGSKPKSPTTPPHVPGQQKQTTQINDHGKVRQCPKCYKEVQPGLGVCPNCGHVFVEVGAVSSSKEFARGIKRMYDEYNDDINSHSNEDYQDDRKKALEDQLMQYISNYPIPFAKEDLLEFIITMDSKRRMDDTALNWRVKEAYIAKYKEAVAKAKVLFPTDEQIQGLIKSTSKFSWGLIGTGWKIAMIFVAVGLIFLGIIISGSIQERADRPKVDQAISTAQQQRDSLVVLLNNLPQPTTKNYKEVEHQLLMITWRNVDTPNHDAEIKVDKVKDDYLHVKQRIAAEIDAIYQKLGLEEEEPNEISLPGSIDN